VKHKAVIELTWESKTKLPVGDLDPETLATMDLPLTDIVADLVDKGAHAVQWACSVLE